MAKSKAQADADTGEVRVWLGNRAAIEEVVDADRLAGMSAAEVAQQGEPKQRLKIPVAKACTFFRIPPDVPLLEGITDITKAWVKHSDDPAPAWVASTSAAYGQILSEHFGGIEVRPPENPDEMHGPYVVDEKGA